VLAPLKQLRIKLIFTAIFNYRVILAIARVPGSSPHVYGRTRVSRVESPARNRRSRLAYRSTSRVN